MSETVERLKGLLERGTTKPWAATTRKGSWDWLIFAPGTPYEVCQMFHDGTEDNKEGESNAELIVSAVNALPGLIACAEALQALMFHVEASNLVRNVDNDHKPDWAIKQIPLIRDLQKAQAALTALEGEGRE